MLIHIFKSGTHTDMNGNTKTYTVTDIDNIAKAYNEQADNDKHYAPIVIGHPTTNAPAYGWVKKLVAKNGDLFAEPEKINPEFKKLVNGGAYRTRSVAFYADGKLRHVGFLGAVPPAVKGLRDFTFAEDDNYAVFTLEREQNYKNSNAAAILKKIKMLLTKVPGVELETVDKMIPDYQLEELGGEMKIEELMKENERLSAEYAEKVKGLEEEISRLKGKEKAVFFAEFKKNLVGKMPAAEQEQAVKLADRMYSQNGAEGVAEFAEFIAGMPVIIPQEKDIANNGVDGGYSEADEYEEYAEVDSERKALNQKTKKIMKEKNLSYEDALKIALQGGK